MIDLVMAHVLIHMNPKCPCGCGLDLKWMPRFKRYSFRATVNCPRMIRPLCECGCGRPVSRNAYRFASHECVSGDNIKQNKIRNNLMIENAPDCPCGRGKMVWRGGKYYYCSPKHHGVSARNIELTERQKQLIMGTLLGDGGASFIKNRITKIPVNARLRIRHSTKRQLEYCQWKRLELGSICASDVLIRDTPKAFGKQSASFSTLSHIFILGQALKLYTPKKGVAREYLDQLDDFGLAVWWMDDGSMTQLSTHSFTVRDQEIIVQYLLERWGVEARISPDKKKGLWFIQFNHPRQIHDIVRKHIIKSMIYKFGNGCYAISH